MEACLIADASAIDVVEAPGMGLMGDFSRAMPYRKPVFGSETGSNTMGFVIEDQLDPALPIQMNILATLLKSMVAKIGSIFCLRRSFNVAR